LLFLEGGRRDILWPMNENLLKVLMPILPKSDLSHWVGVLAHRKWPGLINRLMIQKFAQAYSIDLSEAEKDIAEYTSIGDLFTRRLKLGVRPIGDSAIVHPADGVITSCGKIEHQKLIQAKNRSYNCAELLRHSSLAQEFEGGTFVTYYLCPTDYHRVHSSVDGQIIWSCHVPGEFWPVNEWSVQNIPNLFAENERVVTVIESSFGKVALVMVAATNVGNLCMFYDENICTNRRSTEDRVREHSYQPSLIIKKGAELGMFKMGSTVIALYPAGHVPNHGDDLKGKKVRVNANLTSTL
jgi:phosphatidylserine decarboxylase